MRDRLVGAAILLAALCLSWGIIRIGLAVGPGAVAAVVGEIRTAGQGAAAETVFSLVVFAPLLLAGLAGGAIGRRNAAAPGDRPWPSLGVGLLIGSGGVAAAVCYAWLAGGLTSGVAAPVATLLAWGLAVVLVQTAAEEVFFRGWLQPALAARWGAAPAVGAAALAFAALHIAGAPEMLGAVPLLNMVLGGVMFGLLALLRRGIAAALGVHWAWNASEQLLWGLDPNPGTGGFGAAMNKELTGSAIWGGSADGLNGSIGMTVVLLAILAPLVALAWQDRNRPQVPPGAALTASPQPG